MTEKLWNGRFLKVWAGNFLLQFSFALIVPLLPLYLTDTFGASKDTIGLVLAGYSLMAITVRPFSGYMVDSFSRKTVLLLSYFVFASFFIGYMAAGSLTAFAIFRTLHGVPYGAASVSISTVAIDTLPPSRRSEGIGYFGLSSNFATALGPAAAFASLQAFHGNYQLLFALSLAASVAGLALESTLKLPRRDFTPRRSIVSLDRFFLLKGVPEALTLVCFAFCYGVVSTYVAIYGRQELGITGGTGFFFTLFAVGLIISRLTGAKGLRENRISHNVATGILVSLAGYLLFCAVRTQWAFYLSAFVIGLGNGHMYPGFQNMFINLARNDERGTANSSLQISWDVGFGGGTLAGGVLAEHLGYHAAFWCAAAVNAAGIAFFFLRMRRHFEENKLR